MIQEEKKDILLSISFFRAQNHKFCVWSRSQPRLVWVGFGTSDVRSRPLVPEHQMHRFGSKTHFHFEPVSHSVIPRSLSYAVKLCYVPRYSVCTVRYLPCTIVWFVCVCQCCGTGPFLTGSGFFLTGSGSGSSKKVGLKKVEQHSILLNRKKTFLRNNFFICPGWSAGKE